MVARPGTALFSVPGRYLTAQSKEDCMARKDVTCSDRIFITLNDITREILVFQCKRTGMTKSQYINYLIQSTVDRQYIAEGRN